MNDASPPDIEGKLHAELGPSSSDIWLTCLGAPREWKLYPPKRAGFAAHEGTLAHTLCEAALKSRQIPWKPGDAYTVEGDTVPITQDMLNAVQLYAQTTNILSDFALWRIIEQPVYFDWLWDTPPAVDLFGTADFAAADLKALYVVDFKYGAGKAVHVEGNTQLLCYGIGCYGLLKKTRPDLANSIEDVSLTVVQPRAGGQPVRQWNIKIGDLLYWAYAVLKPSIDKILSATPQQLVAGNHCYFCQAAVGCPAYKAFRLRDAIFPDLTEKELEALDKV